MKLKKQKFPRSNSELQEVQQHWNLTAVAVLAIFLYAGD